MRQQRTNVPQETDGGLSPSPEARRGLNRIEANFEDQWPSDTNVNKINKADEYFRIEDGKGNSPFKRNTFDDDLFEEEENILYF
jgi:hypothetical protein